MYLISIFGWKVFHTFFAASFFWVLFHQFVAPRNCYSLSQLFRVWSVYGARGSDCAFICAWVVFLSSPLVGSQNRCPIGFFALGFEGFFKQISPLILPICFCNRIIFSFVNIIDDFYFFVFELSTCIFYSNFFPDTTICVFSGFFCPRLLRGGCARRCPWWAGRRRTRTWWTSGPAPATFSAPSSWGVRRGASGRPWAGKRLSGSLVG